MKVVIFAGGMGTRLSEETEVRPKPMVEIGGKPILWHIMKIYSAYGFNEFVICLGYKGIYIKEYFLNYFLHNSNIEIDVASNTYKVLGNKSESFKITLVDTGLETKTAGRLKLVEQYIDTENFMLTYGDGLSDVNLKELLDFHTKNNKIATVTAVPLDSRFGGMEIGSNQTVIAFKEKAKDESKLINGGFFVLNKKVFTYLPGNMDDTMWEDKPLEELAAHNELIAYQHNGFWKCMDALRDKIELEELWKSNQAKWKIWE